MILVPFHLAPRGARVIPVTFHLTSREDRVPSTFHLTPVGETA